MLLVAAVCNSMTGLASRAREGKDAKVPRGLQLTHKPKLQISGRRPNCSCVRLDARQDLPPGDRAHPAGSDCVVDRSAPTMLHPSHADICSDK